MRFPRNIYAIVHNKTGRAYIGSSCKLKERLRCHRFNLKAGKHPVEDMQEDYNLYGNDFSIYILDKISNYDERFKEYEYMKIYKSNIRGIGYNYKERPNRVLSDDVNLQYLPLTSCNNVNKPIKRDDLWKR